MNNIVMIPMTDVNVEQLALSALACATSALATLEVQGIAVRPSTTPAAAAFAPFAATGGDVALADALFVKRERGTSGKGQRGIAAHVPGPPAWSHLS